MKHDYKNKGSSNIIFHLINKEKSKFNCYIDENSSGNVLSSSKEKTIKMINKYLSLVIYS